MGSFKKSPTKRSTASNARTAKSSLAMTAAATATTTSRFFILLLVFSFLSLFMNMYFITNTTTSKSDELHSSPIYSKLEEQLKLSKSKQLRTFKAKKSESLEDRNKERLVQKHSHVLHDSNNSNDNDDDDNIDNNHQNENQQNVDNETQENDDKTNENSHEDDEANNKHNEKLREVSREENRQDDTENEPAQQDIENNPPLDAKTKKEIFLQLTKDRIQKARDKLKQEGINSKQVPTSNKIDPEIKKSYRDNEVPSKTIDAPSPTIVKPKPTMMTTTTRIEIPNRRVAGLSCPDGPKNPEEMVFWEDIPEDAKRYANPYRVNTELFLTFEPDGGGWNNIRMAMETVLTMAIAMGRTLVLPPDQKMYLLNQKENKDAREKVKQRYEFSFEDFFHLEAVANEHDAVKIMTMEEYLTQNLGKFLNKNTGKPVELPHNNRTNWNGASKRELDELNNFLRVTTPHTLGHWQPDKCLAVFPNRETDTRFWEDRSVAEKNWLQDVMEKNEFSKWPGYEAYVGKPVDVQAPPVERMKEMWAGRQFLCVYDHVLQRANRVHFNFDYSQDSRLLVHFYAFLFFEDPKRDLWIKRFVRDHIRYIDEIQCASARVVQALRKRVKKRLHQQNKLPSATMSIDNNEDSDLSSYLFDTFHIRRGDFQYEVTRAGAEEILRRSQSQLQPNGTVFIATDEKNLTFFDPFRAARYDIVFLSDFMDEIGPSVNSNYYGMMDQLIASRGRVFFGCWFSTFTGYINRLRGYHASIDHSSPAYNDGVLTSSFYYALPDRYDHMHVYYPVKRSFYAREFPTAWRLIDSTLEDELEQERIIQEAKLRIALKEEEERRRQIGGLNCDRFEGGPFNPHTVEEMVFWEDIPSDAAHQSPFYRPEQEQFVTFEPDGGGWNNIRMSMETVLTMSVAMGRTLVLPPDQRMYLLHAQKSEFDRLDFTFYHFFPLEAITNEHLAKTAKVITMEEFLRTQALTGNLVYRSDPTKVAFPPQNNRTDWNGASEQDLNVLHTWLRETATFNLEEWQPEDCVAVFPKDRSDGIPDWLQNLVETQDFKKWPNWESYVGKPVPVDAPPIERMKEMFAERSRLCIYTPELQSANHLHFPDDGAMRDQLGQFRLLVHFYAFLFFEDWKQDLWMKRFVRDHVRYLDEIQCAAARVVHAVRKRVKQRQNQGVENSDTEDLSAYEFDTFHIRRGDFQYVETKVDADEILRVSSQRLQPQGTIYIGTDERDRSFFKPFVDAGYDVVFLGDFMDELGNDINSNYYGMIDQLVTARGRIFFGCWFSTFTGYITRLRGYHAAKDHNSVAYRDGINPTTYFYTTADRTDAMQEYVPVKKAFWEREYPTSWRLLDETIESK